MNEIVKIEDVSDLIIELRNERVIVDKDEQKDLGGGIISCKAIIYKLLYSPTKHLLNIKLAYSTP